MPQFGSEYARKLKRRDGRLGDTWFLDELFVTIRGKRQSERFFRKLLKGQGEEPLRLVTDKLRSYGAAHRTTMPSVRHDTRQYANNRAEVSHQPTRQRERQMRRFKSPGTAQRFLSTHGIIQNLFRVARSLFRRMAAGDVCLLNPSQRIADHARSRLDQAQVDSACVGVTPGSAEPSAISHT